MVKVPLCLPVAGSAGFGALLQTPALTSSLAAVVCGVFFLACGAAGGNSLQEAASDGLFLRTRNRPMPTGQLNRRQAAWLSGLLGLIGLATLLFSGQDRQPLALGVIALLLYNGLYTPLKKTTVFALFPGGLAGAIPPLIGWTAAGGSWDDSHAWLLASLFFLWQIPHYCLILLHHQEDYRQAALPALIRLLPEQSLKGITLVWTLALAAGALALTLDQGLAPLARLCLTLFSVLLSVFFWPLLLRRQSPDYRLLFRVFNSAFFLTLLLVSLFQVAAAR